MSENVMYLEIFCCLDKKVYIEQYKIQFSIFHKMECQLELEGCCTYEIILDEQNLRL